MTSKAKPASATEATSKTPRASVSFPPELYEEVARIAKEKKVSVAWVVRDAVEKYVADQYPLFKAH